MKITWRGVLVMVIFCLIVSIQWLGEKWLSVMSQLLAAG